MLAEHHVELFKQTVYLFFYHKVEKGATLAKMLHYSTVWHWIHEVY